MTSKPQAKNAGRTDTKKIAPKKPKEKGVAFKKTQNETATYEVPPNHAQLMLEDLDPAHQKEFKDALEIVGAVLAGKSLETAVALVRKNVMFTIDTNSSKVINIAMDDKFKPYYGKVHDETVKFEQEISREDMGTFVIHVSKLGRTALGRRKVEGMLSGKIPKPVEYKDRERVNGKKENSLSFLNSNFGELIQAKAIYAHELGKLNLSLYRNLVATVKEGISSLMPTKSDQVSSDLALLATQNPTAHKIMMQSYART
jgi:hypothetical protein